ncbi:MAG: hypothetical protein M1823_002412 [Watsoniomyces obsoletus]|nr:MAG: hypothetical protein M1823_002412 [Watsoniomyces obsoletus]
MDDENEELFECIHELKDALDSGDMALLKELINQKASEVEVFEEYGRREEAFVSAGVDGNLAAFHVIFELGRDHNGRPLVEDSKREWAIHTAAAWGFVKIVRQLLDQGVDVNAKGPTGETPLGHAMYNRRPNHSEERSEDEKMDDLMDLARLLLDRGAHMQTDGHRGKTALHKAVCHDHLPLVELLIERGGDVNAVDERGTSVLASAAGSGGDWETVELLVKHGAEVRGSDALRHAIRGHYSDLWVVKSLVRSGATPDTYAEGIRTALHEAAAKQEIEVVKFLLDEGFSPNASDTHGNTPLHVAVDEDVWRVEPAVSSSMVKLLIDRGADVNARNNAGETCLHVSVGTVGHLRQSRPERTKLLIDRGVNINAQNRRGETALHLAAATYDPSWGRKWSAEQFREIHTLVKRGASFTMTDQEGRTALHRLLNRRGRPGLLGGAKPGEVEWLLDNGADLKARDKHGSTALHEAVFAGRIWTMKLLLTRGADVEARKTNQMTMLHEAMSALESLQPNAKELVPMPGWDKDPGPKERLACWEAVQGRYLSIINLILDSGVDINAKTSDGTTALHQARKLLRGSKIVQTLLDRGVHVDEQEETGTTSAPEITASRNIVEGNEDHSDKNDAAEDQGGIKR